VQTIKRALETFEDEAHTIHKMSDATGQYVVPVVDKWVRLDISIDEYHDLIITCSRSETGRFQRGARITFRIESISDQVLVERIVQSDEEEDIPVEALIDSEPPVNEGDVEIFIESDLEYAERIAKIYEMELEQDAIEAVIDTPVAAIEQTTGRCVHCAAPAKFTTMTAIGERHFCTEKCWAEYVGQPVMEEGHYGLQVLHDEAVSIEAELEEMDRLENKYDFDQAMGL
jgi:hypothetical protein